MSEVRMTWKGRLAAFLIGCVFLVAFSEAAVRIIYPTWSEFFAGRFMTLETVPQHGKVAVGRAGFDGYFSQNNGDFRAHIKINDAGLRNDDPVSAANGRVWVIGDSMTFGWGVEANEMYSSQLSALLSVPTYNVASPGSDVCGYEALAARMPANVSPAAVVVGLILENDLRDYDCHAAAVSEKKADAPAGPVSLSQIKEFLTEHSALYNFFAVSLKRVSVVREALTWIGIVNKSQSYRDLLSGADLDRVTASTADELVRLREMFDPAIPFVVLVVPARFEINDNDPHFAEVRAKMIDALKVRSIDYVDPFAAFAKAGFAATHFTHDGHWSANGHRIAAAAIAQVVQGKLP